MLTGLSWRLGMWTLFIDETGNFRDAGRLSAVVGWLMPGSPSDRGQLALQRRLRSLFEACSWPPHATELRLPVAHAIQALQASGPVSPELRALAEAARGPLRALSDGSKLTTRDNPKGLRKLDARLLARHPALHARLQGLQDQRESGMAELLAELADQGAWVVIAATHTDPRADVVGPGRVVRDAYVRCLRRLFERLHTLLWHTDKGQQRVHAVVATRNVDITGFPVPAPLGRATIDDVIREASQHPVLARTDARRASLAINSAAGAQKYDQGVVPGLIVADWLANRVGGVLRSEHLWSRASARLDFEVLHGLPRSRVMDLAPAEPPLSTLAVDEDARSLELAAFRGEAESQPYVTPDWAQQATLPWLARARARSW